MIPKGSNLLSGICYTSVEYGWGDTTNGYIIQINDKNYLAYEDPDDGYRSYGVFIETDKKCTNTFPPQQVNIEIRKTGWISDDDGYSTKEDSIRITNPEDDSLILEIGTLWYDSYYPMSHFEYHPQNLPINKHLK